MDEKFILAGKITAKRLALLAGLVAAFSYIIALILGFLFGKYYINASGFDVYYLDSAAYWLGKILTYIIFGFAVFAIAKKGVKPYFSIIFAVLCSISPFVYSLMQLLKGKDFFSSDTSVSLLSYGISNSILNLISFAALLLCELLIWLHFKNKPSFRYTATANIFDTHSLAILSIIFHAAFYLLWCVVNIFIAMADNSGLGVAVISIIPVILGYFIMASTCMILEKRYRKALEI